MKKNATTIIRETRQAYNKIAPHFAETRAYVWNDIKPLVTHVKEKDRVLDIGCGNGRLYQLFKDMPVYYAGIDYSEGQVKIAKKKFPTTQFVVAEMRKLPFLDHEFNVIFCIAVFHHMPNAETRVQALREMKRVLKKDGRIILMNWNCYSEWAKKQLSAGKWKQIVPGDFMVPWKDANKKIIAERYYHGFTPTELEALFRKAGLHLKEQYVTNRQRGDGKGRENIVSILTAGN